MKAKDIMTSNPNSCHPEDKFCSALHIMKETNCGIVPVTDGTGKSHLVGILTDRDIALTMGDQETSCSALDVGSYMNKELHFCHPDDDLKQVTQIMKQYKIHRVPVVDQSGNLEGIIALADIAREVYKEKKEQRQEFKEADLAEIVEAISIAA